MQKGRFTMTWNNRETRQRSFDDYDEDEKFDDVEYEDDEKNEEEQKRQYYEYKFRNNGKITQKPTDKDYDSVVVKRNRHLDGLEGADDYSSFAEKDGSKYVYRLPNGQFVTRFRSQDAEKEAKQQKRASKGRRRVGDSFTVSDSKIADQLFNLVAGNSFVEYGKIGYTEKDGIKETNYIETDRKSAKIKVEELTNLIKNKNVSDFTHSHPFNPGGVFGTKLPSGQDADDYRGTKKYIVNTKKHDSDFKTKMPKYQVYNPYTSDPNTLPYTMEYNERGEVFPDGVNKVEGNRAILDYQKQLDDIMFKKYNKNIIW